MVHNWCSEPNCIVIKIVQVWFAVYLKSTPHPPVVKVLFTGNPAKMETFIFSFSYFPFCLQTLRMVYFFHRLFSTLPEFLSAIFRPPL
jgi:hypothetical protein